MAPKNHTSDTAAAAKIVSWLNTLAQNIIKALAVDGFGIKVPPVKVLYSFPATGGIADEGRYPKRFDVYPVGNQESKVNGRVIPGGFNKGRLHTECLDGQTLVLVSPTLVAPMDIAVYLTHALTIAAYPWETHQSQKDASKTITALPKEWKEKATKVGLYRLNNQGSETLPSATETRATVGLQAILKACLKDSGPCPIEGFTAHTVAVAPKFTRYQVVCEASKGEDEPHMDYMISKKLRFLALYETRDPKIKGAAKIGQGKAKCFGTVSLKGEHLPCGHPLILLRTNAEMKHDAKMADLAKQQEQAETPEAIPASVSAPVPDPTPTTPAPAVTPSI